MNNLSLAINESVILNDAVEAVCPICNSILAAESADTDIYCYECQCVVFQLPIYIKKFN